MYDIFVCICFRTGALEKRGQFLAEKHKLRLVFSARLAISMKYCIEEAINTINLTLLINGALMMEKVQIPI
jgi:hypothetical protein